jgi:hypothetical protein
MPLDSQNPATRTSSMFTMLRCSRSAAAFKASLKLGDTLRFSVSFFTSSNLIAPRRCLCICVMLAALRMATSTPGCRPLNSSGFMCQYEAS